MNMQQKLIAAIAGLMLSTSGLALDLEREHLLDLYHGVDNGQNHSAQQGQEWVNLTAGIAPSYEEDFEDVEFSPLRDDEPKTQFGVFSGDLEESNNSDLSGYPLTNSPTQFGQSEDERYGIFLKKRF